jgi:galactokinase
VTDLLEPVESTFRERFGRAPAWRFRVPGRLEVFGKHTDYAGGRSLVAAVPRGFAFAADAGGQGKVDVTDAVSCARFICRIGDQDPHITAGWHRYALTVVRRLVRNFPSADLSSRVVLASNLPSAAGISSSSALIIGIAEALIAAGRLEETPEWKGSIRSIEDRVSYLSCIENGASFGVLSGDEGVGTHGGSEDHAAIVTSRAGMLQQFSFSPLRCERAVRMPPGWTFVVMSSGVIARKGCFALSIYNRLVWFAHAIKAEWLKDHPDDERSVAELARSGELDGFPLERQLASRLAQLRAEDARVAEATDAFARGDVTRVGELAAASQLDAEESLRNQVSETIDLVALARQVGASAASAFGAGWGGSVWALVKEDTAEQFLAEWSDAYKVMYPRRDNVGFVSPPSNGLQRL